MLEIGPADVLSEVDATRTKLGLQNLVLRRRGARSAHQRAAVDSDVAIFLFVDRRCQTDSGRVGVSG